MKIEPKGALTFAVTSSHSGEVYEVQLATNRPHGWCSCEDYEFRRRPNQKGVGGMLIPERCKHIAAVCEFLVQRVVDEYLKGRHEQAQAVLKEGEKNRQRLSEDRSPPPVGQSQVRPMRSPPIYRSAPYHPPVGRPKPRP